MPGTLYRIGGETRVNSHTLGYQGDPAVAALADGGWVVAWTSFGQDGSDEGVYQQRYDAQGVTVGGEAPVNAHTGNAQWSSDVTGLRNGGWAVTWTSYKQDGSGWGVYQQRYDSSGTAVGGERRVNDTTAGEQWPFSVMALPDGGWVVAWQSQNQDGSGYGAYLRQYNAKGVAVTGEVQVNTATAGDQWTGDIAALDDVGWVVTWSSDKQDGSGSGVYQQRFGMSDGEVFAGSGMSDTLEGTAGADVLVGRGGDDTYRIDNPGDKAVEGAGGGTDTVLATIDYALEAELEHLTATGTAAITLTGNAFSNRLTGNGAANRLHGGSGQDTLDGGLGNDRLSGGLGKDALTGGAGKDVFVFDTRPGSSNLDKVLDFSVRDDSIYLDNAVFKKLGKGSPSKPYKLSKAFFALGPKAKDKDDYLVFDSRKGVLFYDADGAGAGKAVAVATLKKGLKMTYADFFVI